jgi:undecaprenyl-diphosphatase
VRAKKKAVKAAKEVESADVRFASWFTPLRNRPGMKMFGKASDIGDQPPLYAICGGVLAAGVLTGDRHVAKTGLRMLAAHFLAIRMKNAVKRLVDRTRPRAMADNGRYELRKGRRTDSDFSSFPSGHTASSVAVARAVGRDYADLHDPALGLAGAVALAQVVRSKHYTSDLVAGAAIGIAAEVLADKWLEKMGEP